MSLLSMRAEYDPESKGGPTFTDPEALKAYLISYAERDLVRRVLEQASDGYHQIGTTRLGSDPVNSDCRTHDIENLYVASSSLFPTSGQANPTLLAAVLAV
jgi:choline dehydrogenase-like flavoprotein